MTSQLPPIRIVEPTGSYVAGACNIGPAEIGRRRRSGWIGLVAAIVLAIVLIAIGAPVWTRLLVVAPLYVSAIGFCVGFAAAGITNFEALGTPHALDDAEARAADRRHSRSLIARSGVIAVIGAVVVALLPV